VTEPNSPIRDSPHTSRAAQVGWGILICVTLYVCYFSHLGAIGFVGPDEPRYAWIARDMLETGDWVTPRLYGRPWFEKPPLFYWAAALSFKVFGVSEAAARLPSAICALLATLALAWLAMRLYGAETACWLLLLLPTTVGMIGFSHAAATDMPFSGMLTMAMVCAAVILGLTRNENTPILPRTPWLALLLFGFFLGLAVLAKGPAAIVLCGAVFFWAAFTKRWREALRLLHPAAIASFCLTALPWYILCARRNPDFLRVFIIEHNFKRYLTPEFQHIQPFWFYGPVLLVAFLPWTALFLWSAVQGAVHLWRTRFAKESTWFLVCWAGFCVVFFSISQSKLPGYVLPALPAITMLICHLSVSKLSAYQKSLRVLSLLTALLFFVSIYPLVKIGTARLSGVSQNFGVTAGIVFALIGAANLFLGFLPPTSGIAKLRSFASASAILPILFAASLANSLVSSYFPWDPSGRTIAQQLQRHKIPADQLAVMQMSRGMQFSLSFYLHQEIRTWDVDHPTEGYLLAGGLGCKYWSPRPLVCEKLPFDEEATGRFLYRVTIPDSVQGSRSGEHVQKKE
jgi:4-amino-4-deoxy-L-arabinose transferase-like glycosyltransferase